MAVLPQYDFAGKTVLITGAGSGIGWATAHAFASAGATLVLGNFEKADNTQHEALIEAGAHVVSFHQTDVRSEDSVASLVEHAITEFGSIDVAFNNAGIEGPFGPLHELASEDFDRMAATNMRGVWLSMKYELQHMAPNKSGVIINTASTAGVQSIPMVAAYSATKHAIVGLTRGAALEQAANGIRVNAIAPGPVNTGLLSRMIDGQVPLEAIADSVPQKRISTPDEIAQSVLWLASDAAGYITGETLMIDGGLTQA